MEMNFPLRPRSRNSTMPCTFANRVSSLPRPTFSPALKREPRWRTRMEPPVTNSPPKAFTPRRCAFESRPFLELPKPFLCAISRLCQNLAHLHLRVVLPVSDGALVLLFALELEHHHFIAAAVTCDGALHFGVGERGAGDQLVRIVHHGQHAPEFHLGPHVAGNRFHFNHIARRDAVLFSTGFNHCVHNCPSLS